MFMERTTWKSRLHLSFALMFFGSSAMTAAGTVMAPPPVPAALPGAGETYAESSFGAKKSVSRDPAGLEFSNGKSGDPQKNHEKNHQKNQLITHEVSHEQGGWAKTDDPAGERSAISKLDTAPVRAPELDRGSIRRKGVQEISLIAGDLGFFPKTIFVTPDIPVRLFITGASKNSLCLMMDSFQVRKQVRSQKIEEIMFTPTTAGRYRFYCPVNGTEGTLVVRELASRE